MKKIGFFLIFMLAGMVSASVIQLKTTITVDELIMGDFTSVKVRIENTGDERAGEVQLELDLPDGFISEAVYVGDLNPNVPKNITFNITFPENSEGRFPLVLKTRYSDVNHYPFSSVHSTYLKIKSTPPIQMHIIPSEVLLEGQKESKHSFKIVNRDIDDHEVLLKIHLPDEIKSNIYEKKIMINGKKELDVDFKLKNIGALPGSTYVAAITIEHDAGDVHYTSISSSILKVTEGASYRIEKSNILIASILVLMLYMVYRQFTKPKK